MPGVPPPDHVGPLQIYDALIRAGASTTQAIGMMANMINESSLNVETGLGGHTIDSNGYPVYGLVSWNAASYPSAHELVTGNPQQDLQAQVDFLAKTGGFRAASGATGAEAAGNFAAQYERCSSCSPGGQQYQARVANAARVLGWIQSGHWPQKTGEPGTTPGAAQRKAAADAAAAGCLFGTSGIPGTSWISDIFGSSGNLGQVCILSTSNLRAWIGGGLLLVAVPVGLVGIALVVITAAQRTGAASAAGRTAGGTLEAVGAGLAFIPGAEAAGLGIASAGHEVRRAAGHGSTSAGRVAQQRRAARTTRAREERAQLRGATDLSGSSGRESAGFEQATRTRTGAPRETSRQRAARTASPTGDTAPF